jgi:hypothetical protein
MHDEKDLIVGAATTYSFIVTTLAHTFLKTTEFVTNNNMAIIPYPPNLWI